MNLKQLSGNKSRRVSDATSKGIKLPNTNLWFYGTKWDINGNTVAVFSFDKNGGRKWSVQVNAYDAFRGLHLPSNNTPVDIINANSKESIEKAVVKYINEFGTKMQKNGLFVEPNYVSDSRKVSNGANDEFLNQIKEDVENDKMDLDKAACELYQAGYFDELPFNRDVIELCNIDMNKYRWVGSMSKKLIEKPLEEAIRLLGDDWTLIKQYEGGSHDYYYKFVSGDIKESGDEEYITLITDGKYVIDVWTNMNDPWLVKTHRFNDSCKVKDSWLESAPMNDFSALDGFVTRTQGQWNEKDTVEYNYGIYIEDDYSIFAPTFTYRLASLNDVPNVIDGVLQDLGAFIENFDFDYYINDMKETLNVWLADMGHREYSDDELRAMVQEGYDYFVDKYDMWANDIKSWQEKVRSLR